MKFFKRLYYHFITPKTGEALGKWCENPEALCGWMNFNLAYVPDWKKHKVAHKVDTDAIFLKDKKGDCEEFSNLAYTALRNIPGIDQAWRLSIHQKGKNWHAICVYCYEGRWYIVHKGCENHRIHPMYCPNVGSFLECARLMYPYTTKIMLKVKIQGKWENSRMFKEGRDW